jgi:hypothetical protein
MVLSGEQGWPIRLVLGTAYFQASALRELTYCALVVGALRLRRRPDAPGWWPVMVAERTDVHGQVTALHRTYLKHDGSGKAAVEPPRMDLGYVKGTAIRLSPISDELLIGEGIETVLSVMQETGKPGWAAGSAVMLRSWLRRGPRVTIRLMVMNRGTRGTAAYARWIAEGRAVGIARAPGFDFDVLMGKVS